VLGIEVMEIDLDAGRRDAWLREAVEVGVRIDGFDAVHARWIVRQVAPGAEADLQDAPCRAGQRALPGSGQGATAHGQVEQVREDAMMVEAQGWYPGCAASFIFKRCWSKPQSVLRFTQAIIRFYLINTGPRHGQGADAVYRPVR
jgi:hypothetical protein